MVETRAAWVFPGQGAQEIGMGRDVAEASPAAREMFERADAALARPLSRLCFEGPAGELNATANAQPALYVTSLACLAAARESGMIASDPAFVAGHSLGEYTALAAAGAVGFEAGLHLVEERGRVTAEAARRTPGGMAAVLGLDADATRAVCEEAGAELCNDNAPGQIVIGGHSEAVARASALALERGARRVIPLDVTGAFHTSLMAPAAAVFGAAVDAAGLVAPRVPFISNRTAAPMSEAGEIGEALVYQLTHPVRWVECVERMRDESVAKVIEFGPGKVLTGLIKRIAPGMELVNVNDAKAVLA